MYTPRRRRRPLLEISAVASLLASQLVIQAGPALAQPDATPPAEVAEAKASPSLSESLTGVARAEYEAGRVLFADGDFKNAIVKFRKAHDLSKDPRLLWNIAVCEKNLRHYSQMLRLVRRYREEAKDVLTAEDRQQADAIVDTVKQFITDLDLAVNVEGAEVLVDDERIGITPIKGRLTLDVGRRKVTVRKDGYTEQSEMVTVPGGGKMSLAFDLLKEIHRGTLVVETSETALVSIDGRMVGRGGWQGTLRSGGHTLRVSAPEMVPFQQEVVIQDDATRKVEVELVPEAGDTTATVLWVIGGVTLAGAAIVTGAFLFSPSGEAPTEGTIPPGTVQLSHRGGGNAGFTVMSW
ncbi:MAG: PEGA domain-containing protein [Polyangiaceae bacterium]